MLIHTSLVALAHILPLVGFVSYVSGHKLTCSSTQHVCLYLVGELMRCSGITMYGVRNVQYVMCTGESGTQSMHKHQGGGGGGEEIDKCLKSCIKESLD